MEHAFNPRTWEAEATGCVRVRDQPDLHDEFQDSQGYILRPCLKKRERKKERERERKGGRKSETVYLNDKERFLYFVGFMAQAEEELTRHQCQEATDQKSLWLLLGTSSAQPVTVSQVF